MKTRVENIIATDFRYEDKIASNERDYFVEMRKNTNFSDVFNAFI